MNIDIIIKLLRSNNQDDIQLGYEYLYKECDGDTSKMNILLEETNLRISKKFPGRLNYMPFLTIKTANSGDKIKFLKNV